MKSLTALVMVAIVAIAACGDSDSDSSGSAAATTAATAATTESSTPDAEPATTSPPSTTIATTTTTTIAATTTTLPLRDGTRDHPWDLRADAEGGPDLLSNDTFSTILLFGPAPVDPAAISNANRFNDLPEPGQMAVGVLAAYTADDAITEPVTGQEIAHSCSLVGLKSKVYDSESLSDVDGALELIVDQPDVIGGGLIGGRIVYYVDDNDDDLQLLCGDSYIIPAA